DLASIPTGGGTSTQGSSGGGGGGNQGGGGGGALAASVNFGVSTVPLGPTLDVLPYVSSDGFSVQMTLIPNFTEFIGFDDPGPFVPQAQSVAAGVAGVPLTSVLALPRFRVRSVVTSAIIWDGQTIVLGGLLSEDVRNIKDKIPVLGDLPILGRLFRSESKSTSKKNLIIFVTPTIVDPAGNRVNTDEELPFGMNPIPPQPAWLEADRNYRAGW
ncbi:MAG: type II secretion system protein GspD, partial [Verrucomicrobiia bacterium]